MHLVWADKACIKTSIFVLEEQVGLKYTQIFWEMCHQFLKENKLKSSDFLFCIMKVTGFSSENFLSFLLTKVLSLEKKELKLQLCWKSCSIFCVGTLCHQRKMTLYSSRQKEPVVAAVLSRFLVGNKCIYQPVESTLLLGLETGLLSS